MTLFKLLNPLDVNLSKSASVTWMINLYNPPYFRAILCHIAALNMFPLLPPPQMFLCPGLLQSVTTISLECIHWIKDQDLLVVLIPADSMTLFISQNRWR